MSSECADFTAYTAHYTLIAPFPHVLVSHAHPTKVCVAFIGSFSGPSPPTDVAGVQDGPTSIRVTWTPPDPLDGVTGYRIDYTGGSSVDIDSGSTNTYTLENLQTGEAYTISIVAIAPNRPTSSLARAPPVTLGTHQRFLNIF